VAYFRVWEDLPRKNYSTQTATYLVTDLLTGETYYRDDCVEDPNCGGGNDFRMDDEAKAAFTEAITGKKNNGRK